MQPELLIFGRSVAAPTGPGPSGPLPLLSEVSCALEPRAPVTAGLPPRKDLPFGGSPAAAGLPPRNEGGAFLGAGGPRRADSGVVGALGSAVKTLSAAVGGGCDVDGTSLATERVLSALGAPFVTADASHDSEGDDRWSCSGVESSCDVSDSSADELDRVCRQCGAEYVTAAEAFACEARCVEAFDGDDGGVAPWEHEW